MSPVTTARMLTALLLFALAPHGGAAEPLRILASTAYSMPLARFEAGRLQRGLIKDLGEAIAREAGREARFVAMPRNRIATALADGEADIVCDTRPEWLGADAERFDWSEPVLSNPQHVVSHADRPAPQRWSELDGKVLLLVLGYRYPAPRELAEGLQSRRIQRADSINQEALLRKLELGRGDYGIVGDLPLHWYLKTHPGSRFNKGLTVLDLPTRCAVARNAQAPALLAAIRRLADSGALARLTAPYKP